MDQRPTASHGPQVPVYQCGDVQRQQDPIEHLIPSQTDTDDPDWGWLPAGLLHRHVGPPPPTDAQGDSSWGWLPTDLLYRPEELPTSAEARASPRSSLLQLGEAHGEHGEVSSLDGSGGGQYSIEVRRQDLERCPLCYEDALLFPLPCHPLHRLCTLCAYDPRLQGCPWRCASHGLTGHLQEPPPAPGGTPPGDDDYMDLDTEYPEVDFNAKHSSGVVSSASPSSPSALPMRTILQDVVDSEWTRLQLHFEVHFPAVRETPLGSYADLHVHECTRHLQHFLRLTERVFYESKRAILSYALDSATSSTAPPPPPPPPPGPPTSVSYRRNSHIPVVQCGDVERNPGPASPTLPGSPGHRGLKSMELDPMQLQFTPTRDPSEGIEGAEPTELYPLEICAALDGCPSLGPLDPYRLDRPCSALYNAAFKEAMGDIRQYRFPNEVSWVVAAVTAHLDECVYLRAPPDMTLTKPTDPGWLGLIFQGHVKLNAERWDHRIFAVESLLPESHQQSWVADTEVTFLAIPVPVAQRITEESAAYAADTSDMLRTMVHSQLESIIQVQSHDQAMEDGAPQSPMYVTRPAVAGVEEEELKQAEPALGSYLLQLRRLQRGMRSYLTSRPERKVTNCHHRILNSTGEVFFDTRRTQLDHRVAEDILAHYDVTVEYGSDGIHTVFHNATPMHAQRCILHTEVTQNLDPYYGDLTNRTGVLVLPDEQGTKKGFMEAQNRPNATPVVWGGTEDDAIREMVDVLAQGQKAHARKRLLMVYVANKNRDSAIATLRLEQVERPSLRAANRYLAGATKWTGTVNAKYDGWTGDETFAPGFAEPLPLMGVLLDNSAEWRPVEAVESRELDVQNMDHDDLYGNIQDGGKFAIEEDTDTVVLEFPEAMKVNTLHRMFKFLNETDMEVQTSIAMQLPSNSFPFMGAMEARASRSQSTAYEVRLPRRLVAKATRVVAEAAEARYKQDDQLVGPFIINESARELWIVRQRFRVEKEDKISSYEDIIRDFRQNHQLIQGTLMEHVVGMKPVDNYRLMVQFKTTLDRLTLASVLKQINHYEAQNVLTNDMMSGGVSRSKWGYAAVKARALLPNPDRSHATEIFWGASLGVSEYELRVTVASFGRYLTLAEEPSFYMEPTYVHYVRATYENPQSAGLAAGQFLKVKTGVLQCTTGDSTQDALIRDRIDSMLLDVVPDSSQVRLPHRLQYAAKFLGAKEAMAKLHDEHLKTKRLHEPAMDTQEKMMQWDTEDPLLQPKRAKTEAQDARLRMDTRRPTASTASDLKIKTSASKPQLAAPAHKPTVKPKPPTPARRDVPKPARK